MARGTGKKTPKASQPAVATAPVPTSATGPPRPFKVATQSLLPFTSTLPTNHIYLVHVDRTPISLKRRVFVVPVLLNIFITILLCVRIYYAAPVYRDQIITIFGYDTDYTVDTEAASAGDIMGALTNRTFLLMVDYAIFGMLGSWPKEFLFGSKASRFTGPWGWRRTIGFQDVELIVRRGRKWDTPLLEGVNATRKWANDEELSIKFKIDPAMSKPYIRKTGYLLLDRDWDLDFRGMLDAHRLIKSGRVQLKDLEDLCLVFYQNQWLVWKVHEGEETTGGDPEQESKIRGFKDQLTRLGQEDIFFRWIEIVQYETSQPGGFTQGRQAEAMRELRRLLTERGVDYSKFWDEIGGQKGLPGFE